MKNYIYFKVTAVIAVILNFGSSNAQSLTVVDVKNVQYLIEKKVLIEVDGNFQLNQSLMKSDLIQYLDSVKTTNCTGGGSCW